MRKQILYFTTITVLFLGANIFTSVVLSQTKPFTIEQIQRAITLIKQQASAKEKKNLYARILNDIQQRKVDFPLSKENEELLRNEGATDEFIEVIRKHSPPLKTPKQTLTPEPPASTPNPTPIPKPTYVVHFEQGGELSNKSDFDRAIEEYNKAIEINPEFTPAYVARAEVYRKKKQYDLAITDYQEALTKSPNDETAKKGLRLALEEKKNLVAIKQENDAGNKVAENKPTENKPAENKPESSGALKNSTEVNSSPGLQMAQQISIEVTKLIKESKFKEALPLAQKVISIRENELGKNHLLVAQAWENLAILQSKLEKLKESEKAYENVLKIYEKNQSLSLDDEKRFKKILETVGFHQASNGKINEGVNLYIRAVELSEKIYGKDSIETANTLFGLAPLYELKTDYEKALPIYLRVFDIQTKKIDKKYHNQALYERCNCLLTKLGRENEASQLLQGSPNLMENDLNKGIKGGGVINGEAIKLVKPSYPAEARPERKRGTVNVRVLIDEYGRVISACAISGERVFHRVTEIAAYQSKFVPTLLGGKPVKVNGIIVYNFVP